jgi:hypothetical protein
VGGVLAGIVRRNAVILAIFQNGVAGDIERLIVATDKDRGKGTAESGCSLTSKSPLIGMIAKE